MERFQEQDYQDSLVPGVNALLCQLPPDNKFSDMIVELSEQGIYGIPLTRTSYPKYDPIYGDVIKTFLKKLERRFPGVQWSTRYKNRYVDYTTEWLFWKDAPSHMVMVHRSCPVRMDIMEKYGYKVPKEPELKKNSEGCIIC